MSNFDSFKITNPAYEAVQKMQSSGAIAAAMKIQESSAFAAAIKMETLGAFGMVRELQKTLEAVRAPLNGATAMLEEYYKTLAPIRESLNLMHTTYAPIFEATKTFDSLNMKGLIAGLKTSMPAMTAISKMDLVGFASIIDSLPKYDFLSSINTENFTIKEAEELFENGEITQEDINDEFVDIVTNKKFSPKAEWDKIQKSKWLLAIRLLICIVAFLGQPLTDYVGDKVRDAIGVTQLIEEYELYDVIDDIFEYFKGDKETVTEEEAKETVDTTKTGNISKQKREDLLAKIKEIRTFISAAPQDENTGNLLSYLSELEKDVNGKKYGLVFEEHREEIDEVLATHTPVLTEDEELFIDNGGQMNFLIEGDNLASLKMLEKTHRGKIDLIYIDPPYNTGNQDFIYDDMYVAANDGYHHSKWISFVSERLKSAKRLLSKSGVIAISIGYQEVNNLMLLCKELFYDKNVTCVTVQTSGGKPNGGFNITYEFIVFITPEDFSPNASESAMNEYASPYHGMNLATFDQVQRPGQAYPIFVDKDGVFLGCGKSLTERVKSGEYTGELQDFIYDYSEAPEGAVAIWPVTRKGSPCVWRLIPTRLARDWEKGYIKIVPQNPGKTQNLFTVQYLSDGIIKKIESGELETHRISEDSRIPTIDVDNYRTAGTTIQAIWTEKAYYTTNGGNEMADILGSKKAFSYPKPIALISEIVQRISGENSIILDFFAGSGTTGHAVMKLNAEDGGNRRFILCTNNENNICRDVTYERINRAIDKEGYEACLKYYKVEYIPVRERMYYEYADELLRHIRELVELENGVDFTNNAEIAIVLTDEELEDFISNIDDFSMCKKLYMGHDLLPDEEQEQAISSHEIEVNIIPDYYYRDLQEG